MAKQTFYVVQPFEKRGRRTVAGVPTEARNKDDALRIAERLSQIKLGVIAFSRAVDPDSDDVDEPVLIATYGDVPDEAMGG